MKCSIPVIAIFNVYKCCSLENSHSNYWVIYYKSRQCRFQEGTYGNRAHDPELRQHQVILFIQALMWKCQSVHYEIEVLVRVLWIRSYSSGLLIVRLLRVGLWITENVGLPNVSCTGTSYKLTVKKILDLFSSQIFSRV